MGLGKLFLLVLVSKIVTSQIQSSNAIIAAEDNNIKWDKLFNRLGQMMLNSDVAQKKKSINVIVVLMLNQRMSSEFEGMHKALLKHGQYRITFNTMTYRNPAVKSNHEFVLLLMHSYVQNYALALHNQINLIFPDLSTKFIVIIVGSLGSRTASNVWSTLTMIGFFNVYVMYCHNSGEYIMHRTYLVDENFNLMPTQDIKYVTVKEISENSWILYIRVIFYNSYPMSYIQNGEIIGSEGKLIQELSKRIKIPNKILNKDAKKLEIEEATKYMAGTGDISLHSNLHMDGENIEMVWLNEMDGLCILTPRNIPVSSYDNLALPLDAMSLVMSFISTISVIVSWKMISTYTANGRPIKSIIVAVLEMAFNIGASGIEQITKKEVILLYSFIFSSIILVSFYESLLLAFMLAEPSWRSAHDLTELNDTGAKFYRFYSSKAGYIRNIPHIREDLILKVINMKSIDLLDIPENFNANLVYLVTCKYADSFMKSTRNFRENSRIFDTIKINEIFQGYPLKKGFPYADEFKKMVRIWAESGIHKYWQTQSIEKIMKSNKQSNNQMEQSYDVQFLLSILIIGLFLSFGVFLYEIFIVRFNSSCLNRLRVIKKKQQNQGFIKKIKLSKWMNKFIYKKEFQFISNECKQENFKCRESISGGYFVVKKLRNIKKTKQVPIRIQVRPYRPKPRID